MDDRWSFLYCVKTELRGHTEEAIPRIEDVGKVEAMAGGKRPAEMEATRQLN